jgi:hypothetical protein
MGAEISIPGSPTPEQVLSALDRTGFVFEHRVARKLCEFGFTVDLNDAFVDPESGKSREIDVIASSHKRVRQVGINVTVIAECKNFADPLIVLGHSGHYGIHSYFFQPPVITFDPLQFRFANRDPEEYCGIYATLDMHNLPSCQPKAFVGGHLIKMRRHGDKKWDATNDSVYDSIIYPLAKATKHFRKRWEDDDYLEPWVSPFFDYVFPALITAGEIFAVDVLPNEEPTVKKVKWASLMRKFAHEEFLMDVVSFDYVGDYLQERVLSIQEEAKQTLAQNIRIFNPELLVKEYGSTSDPTFLAWLEEFPRLVIPAEFKRLRLELEAGSR